VEIADSMHDDKDYDSGGDNLHMVQPSNRSMMSESRNNSSIIQSERSLYLDSSFSRTKMESGRVEWWDTDRSTFLDTTSES